MESLLNDIGDAYRAHIEASGREIHFLILISFVCTFGFIRTSAHMIRAEVSWWPGNVETKGGTHIHHMVWGILLLLTMGYSGMAFENLDSPWLELVAVAFGIGMGLTLDEFALWLNLKDVYWTEQGRQSIDAVIVASALLVIMLLGLQFWIDVHEALLLALGVGGKRFVGDESLAVLIPFQLVGACLAVITLLKGRIVLGVAAFLVPLLGLVGALMKARPDSRWAKRRARSTV